MSEATLRDALRDLRSQLDEALAKVAECEAEHPPEPEYLAWCAAGKPDPKAIRDAERERCAQLAEEFDPGFPGLAAVIRNPEAVPRERPGLVEQLQGSLGIKGKS